MWQFILRVLKPFVKWWGKFHFPWTHKKITGDHYYMWRDLITPGCVLLTSTKGEFSNLINPIEIKHGGLYVGGDVIKYVAEAVGSGVVKNNLVKFMTTKDVFIVVKPKFGDVKRLRKVCENANKYMDLPYDYMFEKGKKAFYCFELVAQAYLDEFPDLPIQCREIVKGKKIYDASTYLEDSDLWEVVLDSRKELQE